MQQISLPELQMKLWHFNTAPLDALGNRQEGEIKKRKKEKEMGQTAFINR